MAGRLLARIALAAACAAFLVGCGASDQRYYLGAFEQNQELRELFRLYDREKVQENRFVLITQIASGLATAGRLDREILFLTGHVEQSPSDIYNGYYLLLVADAYRDTNAAPLAIHYYRRILNNYGDLLVRGVSIHLQCLQDLITLETDPEERIDDYKQLFSRFPEQSPGVNWYNMAKSYEQVGEWEQAMQAYQKYIGSADSNISGDSTTLRDATEKVNFYNSTDRSWLVPDLDTLVAAVKDAISTKNMSKLRRYEAKVNFFQEPWDQSQIGQDETVNYDITNYLGSSNVSIDDHYDLEASGQAATLRTTGWNFRPATWYLYFRQVEFPENPDINMQWEWAGVYFGEKLLAALVVLAAVTPTTQAGDIVAPAVVETPAAPPADDGPLPSLQGIEAAEMYWLPIPDEDIIGRYVAGLVSGRLDWLQAVLDRSRAYQALIEGELQDRNMPRELAFLPAVESGFQPRAVSPRGATGLWQLMRNTAQPYGLRMDVWLDERRDPWRATEASIAKLAENEAIFGDWYLALAAYNCGVGKLSGILRRYPGADFWALRRKGVLPKETAAFVPQFLALTRILSHPGRYGLSLGWDAPPSWELVPLDRCVDLRILSRVANVPLDALMQGNPGLNFMVTPPGSYGYLLKVPTEDSGAVTDALHDPTLPLLEFRVHVVVEGDTLSEMAKSYGVSVAMIQEFNPAVKERALRIGAKILVPLVPAGSKS